MDMEAKTPPFTISMKYEKDMSLLAYHRIVSTFKIDQKVQDDLKVHGLLCFGGKDEKGKLQKDLFYYGIENKSLWDYDTASHSHRWIILETFGVKP